MSSEKFSNLVDMQQKSVAKFGTRRAFGTKQHGTWQWTTYADFGRRVDNVRGGLAARGVGKGDAVAIISTNRVEWAIAAYATYGLGAMFVPMYEHQLEREWNYILNDSGAKLLLAATRDIYDRVVDWPAELDQLESVVGLDLDDADDSSLANLELAGKAKPAPVATIDPHDLCGFIYTSGTTGKPKGVLLSHNNFTSNIIAMHQVFPLDPDDSSVSFLPWAHSFGQTVELHAMLSMGCAVALAESIEKLVDNFGEVRPTVMVSVPRIFNKIYDGVRKRMAEEGGLKQKLFEAAIANEAKRERDDSVNFTSPRAVLAKLKQDGAQSLLVELQHEVFDRLVFTKIRARFGGRLKYAFSGGAALAPEVAEFIDRIGIMVYEGYGLTETSPIATANHRGGRKIGSVGRAIPGVTIKIDTSAIKDDSSDGEIIVYGPNVMKGYHNLPEETAAVMTEDGGFRTGDRGRMDADGFVFITGRIKEQYKLENGKYVVPAPLEEQLQLSPNILQAYIDGANKPYNVALIVADREALEKWAKAQGMTGTYEQILDKSATKRLVRGELDRHSAEFKGYERIREFALLSEEFTTENGMLTPKMSLKRRRVAEKYGDLLSGLWN